MRLVPVVLVLAATATLGFGSALAAADKKPAPPTQQEVEKMSGKDLYKFSCKSCHGKDSPAGEYTPMTLIQEQWETFFDRKYVGTHQVLVDSAGARPAWITPELLQRIQWLSPKLLERVRKFAVDGAADGEHPMTCG